LGGATQNILLEGFRTQQEINLL